MDTKKVPAIIVLLGCATAAIASYINHYPLKKMLITILWVLIVFYILGIIVKVLFDKYIPPAEETGVGDEGSVIEKQTDENGVPLEDGEYSTESEAYESVDGLNEVLTETPLENPEESG